MTAAEYIRNLTRLKDQAVLRFSGLSAAERQIVEASFQWLVNNLDIREGEIQVTEDLTNRMNQFVLAVTDIVNNNATIQTRITGFLTDLRRIRENVARFQATANNFNIQQAGITEVQEAVVNEIIDQYTGNGLNQHFAAPLRDLVYRNMLAGMNLREAKQVLNNYILGGQDQSGKLSRYLTQTAQQGVDSYTGAINQQLVQRYEFTGYIISGSLIATSSKQCIYAVTHSKDGYLTMKQMEQVLDIARNNSKARLIPGTTLHNLPINKLHWGCRHDFTPVVRKD